MTDYLALLMKSSPGVFYPCLFCRQMTVTQAYKDTVEEKSQMLYMHMFTFLLRRKKGAGGSFGTAKLVHVG